jgi:hypothetical protein
VFKISLNALAYSIFNKCSSFLSSAGWAKSPCAPTIDNEYIQRPCTLIQIHFLYFSYNKCWKLPPCVCSHASTPVNLFAKTCSNSIREMFLIISEMASFSSSVQGECDDCLCKMHISLFPKNDTQGDIRSLKLFCLLNTSLSSIMEMQAMCAVAPSCWNSCGQFHNILRW